MGCGSIRTFASSSRVCKCCAVNGPAAWTGFSWPWPPAMIIANIRRFARRETTMADSDGKNRQESRGSSPKKTASGVFLSVVLALGLSGCGYNTMVSMKEQVQSAWAQVENQLQRRNDLIPNLVETTKGYASHESQVFEDIAASRAKLAGATTPTDQIAAANQQSAALGRLLVIVENYPQLKANEQFNRLLDELSGTENRLAVERMRYNERVQEYNTSRRQFPANLTAKMFGFKEYPFFQAPPEAKQVPKVNFSKPS